MDCKTSSPTSSWLVTINVFRVNAARDEDYAGATEELPEAPQYAKQEVPDYLTVKAAHNDAEITDEELEKMERDSMLIREMVKKQKR